MKSEVQPEVNEIEPLPARTNKLLGRRVTKGFRAIGRGRCGAMNPGPEPGLKIPRRESRNVRQAS